MQAPIYTIRSLLQGFSGPGHGAVPHLIRSSRLFVNHSHVSLRQSQTHAGRVKFGRVYPFSPSMRTHGIAGRVGLDGAVDVVEVTNVDGTATDVSCGLPMTVAVRTASARMLRNILMKRRRLWIGLVMKKQTHLMASFIDTRWCLGNTGFGILS